MSRYSLPQSTRDHFVEPPTIIQRLVAGIRNFEAPLQRIWSNRGYDSVSTGSAKLHRPTRYARRWSPRRLLNLPHLLVGVWVILLLWGEKWVFQNSIDACKWDSWEKWPKDATPHHLIFLADPQLIDPHSYPERPQLVQSLTIRHTDNYMKRTYVRLQKVLHPDTIFFLGDLFDGGREWKTSHGNDEDPDWAKSLRPADEQAYVKMWNKKYKENFWLHEYDRFGRIFFKYWNLGGKDAGPGQRGRKIISTLPGNHDLGFGAQIKIPVRNRFETYFGHTNRVDVVGNHTFVSIDAVSLSAGGSEHSTPELTRPVEEFLDSVQATKRKAVDRELRYLSGKSSSALKFSHKVEGLATVDFKNRPSSDPGPNAAADFPTVLLTHVPLYREPGTPCGPKREHWPPATPPKGETTPVVPDHRNAISISKGYQYQNVLSEDDSVKLINKIGNVVSVFSGDDHDYCELEHSAAKNHAREITVKSMSWAMGVRKPGFLLLSMWNPVSPGGHSLNPGVPTTQSHLCLLPDQLGIFIRYLTFLVLTLLILIVRAILVPVLNLQPFSNPTDMPSPTESSLLPTSVRDSKRDLDSEGEKHSPNSSTSSTLSTNGTRLAARSSAARTRSVSPANGYGLPSSQARHTPPLIQYAGTGVGASDSFAQKSSTATAAYEQPGKQRRLTPLQVVVREAWTTLFRVAWVVVLVYLYLIYYG